MSLLVNFFIFLLYYFSLIFLFRFHSVDSIDQWTALKQLRQSIQTYLSKQAVKGSPANLELILQKHKADFVNLLQNSVRH